MEYPKTFPSPFSIATPPGCEGWQQLYPYYHVFSEERRSFEEGKFWFTDKIHHADILTPFGAIMGEVHWLGLSQYNTRVFLVPPALGIDQRIVNGYLYLSPNTIDDPDEIARRAKVFAKRAGYYFDNWERLYGQWQAKVQAHIEALEAVEIADLPEIEPEEMVTDGVGVGSGYRLIESYDRVIESLFKVWQYHFEMLNLGYAAYLSFMEFCKTAFPGIHDQSVAKMVAGIDVLLFRPDDELRKLAHLAVELGVAASLRRAAPPADILAEMSETENGRRWIDALEQAKRPWFNFSSGTGLTHTDRSWIDDLSLPFMALRGYVERLEAGEEIGRPLDAIRQERDRIVAEYGDALQSDAERKTFSDLLNLSRTVFPYVENHNFFVEHWHHTVFWNRIREFGAIFVQHRFLADAEDIFYLNRHEIQAALFDLAVGWAVGTPARGPGYWPGEVERRKTIISRLRKWAPPPALGTPPERIDDPFMIMLWGMTGEVVRDWLGQADAGDGPVQLKGCAASPGIVEGIVRVVTEVGQLSEVQPDEILICPVTSPSWAPVFGRIKAAVSDVGGIMSHAAIVAREYGLPAVVGTGLGTQLIRTGQRVRVNGDMGTVSVLQP